MMSNTSVSMKMSPKAAGALYMKNIKQEERIAELEKERDELKALALLITPEVIDLIRCGIGGNYGGDRYIEKMEETHAPILARFKAIKESKS